MPRLTSVNCGKSLIGLPICMYVGMVYECIMCVLYSLHTLFFTIFLSFPYLLFDYPFLVLFFLDWFRTICYFLYISVLLLLFIRSVWTACVFFSYSLDILKLYCLCRPLVCVHVVFWLLFFKRRLLTKLINLSLYFTICAFEGIVNFSIWWFRRGA